ncbi:collagen alpha-1(I) chain-like [Manis pentadactyla]|uniref:collagen alpha-1(I) chain-like n=1 Tax=Manis pentadactyla TaxID=143292 RepID=UPI00255C6321|nr:collagen alpha-1(I) chain-like [Manis pentadactyla]XP_057344161.1 collagen alpha-1(I) chain-like [Manis pentadactyla]
MGYFMCVVSSLRHPALPAFRRRGPAPRAGLPARSGSTRKGLLSQPGRSPRLGAGRRAAEAPNGPRALSGRGVAEGAGPTPIDPPRPSARPRNTLIGQSGARGVGGGGAPPRRLPLRGDEEAAAPLRPACSALAGRLSRLLLAPPGLPGALVLPAPVGPLVLPAPAPA